MRCKCGNESGKPLVNPAPKSFKIKGEIVHVYYMGGHNQHGQCWFCAFPRVGIA